MKVREKILSSLKTNIGSGRVHIIFTPKGVDAESFLLNDVKVFLERNYENCIISYFDGSAARYQISLFNSLVSSNRVFVLIHDLSRHDDPTSLINTFYGNKNIDVIVTTSVQIERVAGKDITDIRGRYDSYFCPPYLYGDEINDGERAIKTLFDLHYGDYKFKDIAERVYHHILLHVGETMSYRRLFASCGEGVSLATFVEIINTLRDTGLIYVLRRTETDDFKEVGHGYAFYPSRCFDALSEELDIDDGQKKKGYYDSTLVAKALYDGQKIWKAHHPSRQTSGSKRPMTYLNDCFLLSNLRQYVLVKTLYNDANDAGMNLFLKQRGNIKKIIASDSDEGFFVNEDGILTCGIKHLLDKGVFSFGGI